MAPMQKIAGIVFVLLLISSLSFADTIYLKNGKTIVGEIYQESTYSIKVKVKGRARTLYRHEILKIEKEKKPVPKPKPMVISERKKELILRLLESNGSRDNIRLTFAQIISRAPEESREQAKELLKADEVIQRLVPIYAKHYTEEELKELIVFFKSPTGQKHLATIPKIMEDALVETVQYFKQKVAALEE